MTDAGTARTRGDGRGAGGPEAPGSGGRAAPVRFQQGRRWGWRRPEGGLCCGDPRCRFGSRAARPAAPTYAEHLRAREAFRAWAMAPEQQAYRERARRELRGRDLGCNCPLEMPCHVDVLLGIAAGGPAGGAPAGGAAELRRAWGSDGRTYALRIGRRAEGARVIVTSGGQAVAEDARGGMWISGTGTRLELIPGAPPADT